MPANGGGNRSRSYLCFHFAKLTPIFLLSLVFITSGCFSASAESDLRPYYDESCHLMEVGHDSLCRFDGKIQGLTRAHVFNLADALYDEILDNIGEEYQFYSSLHISIDEEWADTIQFNFF